ncbi:MAG: gamma-glutamyl-gamma-aminobutyrate hydrolase family protein [Bacillota bacterium]
MPPVIGITCGHDLESNRYFVAIAYVNALVAAGACPVLLPAMDTRLISRINFLQGVVFSGGNDVDPIHFGEEPIPGNGEISPDRDVFELALARLCLRENIPLLAICRGMQVLNIAAGGDIYQDIHTQVAKVLKHMQQSPRWHASHGVEVKEASHVHKAYAGKLTRTNSFHHQAVRQVAPGFQVTATSPDGLVEAIEFSEHPFVVGVQWHPEAMWRRHPEHIGLFKALVRAAERSRN